MALAGRTAEAGRIPGQRVATEIVTSDSADFTSSEVVLVSLTASLVSGRRYAIVADVGLSSDSSGDRLAARIREGDSTAGTILQNNNVSITTSSGVRWPAPVYAEYTASATGDQDFVVTGQRLTGSGNCRLEASSSGPTYFYVNYIEG